MCLCVYPDSFLMSFDSALETGNKKKICSRSIWISFLGGVHHSDSKAKDRFKCWQKQNLPAGAVSCSSADREMQKKTTEFKYTVLN